MFIGAFIFAIVYVKCAEWVVTRDMLGRIKIFPEQIEDPEQSDESEVPEGIVVVEALPMARDVEIPV
jgi:hypothetical protein